MRQVAGQGAPDPRDQPRRLHRPGRIGLDDVQLRVGPGAGTQPQVRFERPQPLAEEHVDPCVHVAQAAVVEQQHIGRRPALLVVGLRGDPRDGLLAAHPAGLLETPDPLVPVGFHDDDQMVRRCEPRLDEKRDVVDHDRVGCGAASQFGGPGAYARVNDLLELPPCLLVAEDHRTECGPVELAGVGEHPRPEHLDDLGETRRAGRDDLAGEHIGIDDHRTVTGEAPRDRALACPDPPGKTNLQHAAQYRRWTRAAQWAGYAKGRPDQWSGRPFGAWLVPRQGL
jgi:hypothetical protein